MRRTDFDHGWQEMSAEVLSGFKEWRVQHPRASWKEIETALDERLTQLRTRLLQDAALASDQADWTQGTVEERPQCPSCRRPLGAGGTQTRQFQTHGGHEVVLERQYGVCPQCGVGFFPPR
jgi:YgiT-type zinc finger domain-containing protein